MVRDHARPKPGMREVLGIVARPARERRCLDSERVRARGDRFQQPGIHPRRCGQIELAEVEPHEAMAMDDFCRGTQLLAWMLAR